MDRVEFHTLLNTLRGKEWSPEEIAKKSFSSVQEVQEKKSHLKEIGWISSDDSITRAGLMAMSPYKVDNAIIMAAGLSSRCLPLSKLVPKGLFSVKGEILVEREIQQLRAVGIKEIILVIGYMKEQFEYLKDKYDITLVENREYEQCNNISSLYAARSFLGNTYVCCSDNYFAHNIFEPYAYESYYTCKYAHSYVDEYCIVETDGAYIKRFHRGGENCCYTMGAVYFGNEFSKKFINLLESEYHHDDVQHMLVDDFHMLHVAELPSTYIVYDDSEIKEFDTLEEFQEFDHDFRKFYSHTMQKELFERYRNVERYDGVPTNWVTGRLHYNENLFGPSPKSMEVLYGITPEDIYLYDSAKEDDLLEALSYEIGIDKENIFLHNGSAESIKSFFSVMLREGDIVLLPKPGWSYYSGVVDYKFGKKIYYDILETEKKCVHDVEDIMRKAREYHPKIIVITSPAMPTGNRMDGETLERIVREFPSSMVLVDEAYYGFSDYDVDVRRMVTFYANVVFSRTFSKLYGLANMRIGYGICSKEAMHALWLDLPLHRLPHISKRMAIAALSDKEYYQRIRNEIIAVREWFCSELNKLPNVRAFQSDANFVYISLEGYDVPAIRDSMKQNGYLIRIFEGNGADHLRITIAPKEIMSDCLHKLRLVLKISRVNKKTEISENISCD